MESMEDLFTVQFLIHRYAYWYNYVLMMCILLLSVGVCLGVHVVNCHSTPNNHCAISAIY